jgi:chromosome segregation ATPase
MSDDFTEIARRFFNEFLDLKVQLDAGKLDRKDWSKEIDGYRKMISELKKAASDFAEQNVLLEDQIGRLEEEKAELRRHLNEAIMNLGRLQEKVEALGIADKQRVGYSFSELMDEDSRRLFESLMKELPRSGGH